jgi:hypothetical protein
MLALLRLPPLFTLGIILALAAYLVYRLVAAGRLPLLAPILSSVSCFIPLGRALPMSEGNA